MVEFMPYLYCRTLGLAVDPWHMVHCWQKKFSTMSLFIPAGMTLFWSVCIPCIHICLNPLSMLIMSWNVSFVRNILDFSHSGASTLSTVSDQLISHLSISEVIRDAYH